MAKKNARLGKNKTTQPEDSLEKIDKFACYDLGKALNGILLFLRGVQLVGPRNLSVTLAQSYCSPVNKQKHEIKT